MLEGLPIDVVQLDTNGGFASGCNEGWRRGDAPFVLFLNPDARIDPESLGRLVTVLVSDDRAGLVGPKVCYPGGSLHLSLRRFPRRRSTFARALFLHRALPRSGWTDELVRDEAVYDRPGVAEWVSGACMLVRRTLLERLDGLDAGFFLYCEDTDLCKRVSDAGLRRSLRTLRSRRARWRGFRPATGTSACPRMESSPVCREARDSGRRSPRAVRTHSGDVASASSWHRETRARGAVIRGRCTFLHAQYRLAVRVDPARFDSGLTAVAVFAEPPRLCPCPGHTP